MQTLTASADGKTLATIVDRSDARILSSRIRAAPSASHVLMLSQANEFDDWSSVRWSADGNLLLNNFGHRLLKVALDGKSQTDLLSDPNGRMYAGISPTSPNCVRSGLATSRPFRTRERLAYQYGWFRILTGAINRR